MIGLLADVVSGSLVAIGALFTLAGGIGLLRLPDFYTRLHGSGVTDTAGAGFLIAGLMVHAVKVGVGETLGGESSGLGPALVTIKLAMILFFLLITSPTGCHALAQAALSTGIQPLLREPDGDKEESQQ